jgi:Family of unknown function (DUF5906)
MTEPTLDLGQVGQALSKFRNRHTLVAINMRANQPTQGWDVDLSDPASWAAAGQWITGRNSDGWNIYFHPNETRWPLGKKAKKADIVSCDWAQADIDPTKGKDYETGKVDAAMVAQHLSEGDAMPTMLFNSGNGFYPLWKLSEPISVEEYDHINKAWNASIGVHGTFNADRILKVPGTIAWSNKKKLDAGYPVASQSYIVRTVGPVLDVERFRAVGAAIPKPVQKQDVVLDDAEFTEAALTPPLVLRIEKLKTDHPGFARALGSDCSDRSDALIAIAHVMVVRGFTSNEFVTVVLEFSKDAGDHVEDQKNPLRALKRAWQAASADLQAHLARLPADPALPPGAEPITGEILVPEREPLTHVDDFLRDLEPMELQYRAAINPADLNANARAIVSRYFTENGKRTLVNWRDQYYRWDRTHWEPVADGWVWDILFHVFSKVFCVERETKQDGFVRSLINATKPFISNYMGALQAVVKRPARKDVGWSDGRAGTWQAVRNGILDMNTRCLVPHDPDFFNTTFVDAEWQPDAEWSGSVAERFYQDMLVEDDQIALRQEWMGYILSGDRRFQKAMMIVGAKRSGKGTDAALTKALMPNQIASAKSSELADKFTLERTIGMAGLVIPDVRLSKDSDFAMISETILTMTGNDDVDIRRMHKPAWHGHTTARLWMMSNTIPQFHDEAGVVASRFLYLICPSSFYGREDPDLLTKLLAERSVVLHWAVEGWQRLLRNGRFTVTGRHADILFQAEAKMDPIGKMIEEHFLITGNATDHVTFDMLYEWFQWFCRENNIGAWTKEGFASKLNAKPLNISRGKTADGTVRVYRGITYRAQTGHQGQ